MFLDFLVAEAASVLCRRSEERRTPDPAALLARVGRLVSVADITWATPEIPRLWERAWQTMQDSRGQLNFNDSLAVCLLRERLADGIATLDDDFDNLPGIVRFGGARGAKP